MRCQIGEWPRQIQDQNLKNLISQLLKPEPQTRLGMAGYDALRAHPFFNGVNWDRVRRQEEPIPAYDVVYDPYDRSKVISFSLVPTSATELGAVRPLDLAESNNNLN